MRMVNIAMYTWPIISEVTLQVLLQELHEVSVTHRKINAAAAIPIGTI